MNIQGLTKTTLLDYPGHVAATIFVGGCNFVCPFCHNGSLVLQPASSAIISEEELFAFLNKRKSILTGVCITGGEPTLQPDLISLIRKIKALGYLVKLDSNGYRPEVLASLLDEHLLDYVAMDIKGSPDNYALYSGLSTLDLERIKSSVTLLMKSTIPYEFRTTAVKGLHKTLDFTDIASWIAGCHSYFIQNYTHSDGVIQPGFESFLPEELEEFLALVKPYIPNVIIRGVT